MIRILTLLILACTFGCDATKSKSSQASDQASASTSATATVTATATATPTARPSAKVQATPVPVINAAVAKVVPLQPSNDDGKAVVTTLMETMIRRDIDGARSLFPSAEFLTKHFPNESCKPFREKISANRQQLFPASRTWVRESIARILHPKDWKKKMTEMKDEIATSLELKIRTIDPVANKVTSLGKALDACKEASQNPGVRYRAFYQAEILGKKGEVQLDGEVMKLANQGWFVVGY